METIFEVVREISFCYGHRLLNYNGKCKHLHGHNGLAIIKLAKTNLNELGMVIDFADIKTHVSNWIDQTLDHKLILCKDDPLLPSLQALNETVYVMEVNPTAENIAKLIFDYVKSKKLPITEVTLWETTTCYATYKEA